VPHVSIAFRSPAWEEEVERLDSRSAGRVQAERARREIEGGKTPLAWKRCKPEGEDGTELSGCSKLYVPLDAQGASAAPYGLIFRLAKTGDNELVWSFMAFGERHPDNPGTRSVYERAHKRIHGRFPEEGS
jgi:hypothetical protein